MITRLLRSLSTPSLALIFIGCIILATLIQRGDFPNLFMPAHDFEDVIENGLKNGEHIKGDIAYSLGGFATKESYTQYENSRTASKVNGYYYLIPAGEGGTAAIYVNKDKMDAMDKLTEETYEYLKGGEKPVSTVHFEGVAVKMEKNLKGLEKTFRKELQNMGYTESEIKEMLDTYTGGECLVLSGIASIKTFYVLLTISVVAIIIGVLLIVLKYKKEKKYDEQNTNS